MQWARILTFTCLVSSSLVGGCKPGVSADPVLQDASLAPLRPCYVPRADLFYFERDWLRIKGRELDALKFGNALWWLGEASWNEAFDSKEIYGTDREIFGTLSRAPQGTKPSALQRARFLFMEERDEPLAPILMAVQITEQKAFFYTKSLTRGKRHDPGGGACWGGLVIQEQRVLSIQEAQPTLECARTLMEDRVRAEPWKPLPEEGRDLHFLVEYQGTAMHGLAQHSSLATNFDGVNMERLRQCYGHFMALARKKPAIPSPTASSSP